MKKFSLLCSALLMTGLSYQSTAQTFVSTTPSNKNVVLEEFTGIKCQFCPSGHNIADQIVASNPGRVFPINVHAGGYASPSTGQLDFRTPEGQDLADFAQVTGYPAGSVNRRIFTGGKIAMSRGSWSSYSNTVLAESSPVNIAAQATINERTRELEVVVETYYTAGAANPSNRIHVALLQDSILEYQSGASTHYPAMIDSTTGDYIHMKALRKQVTGTEGYTISPTTTGSFHSNTFSYVIPPSIENITTILKNMSVIIYVSEDKGNVLTGNKSSMTIVPISGTPTMVDASISTVSSTAADLCTPSYTPSVQVTNSSANSIDSYKVSYSLNNGTVVSQIINTALAAGQTTTVTFPAVNLAGGENNIEYTYQLGLNSNNLMDSDFSNNTVTEQKMLLNDPAARNASISDDFESYTYNVTTPANAIYVASGSASAGNYPGNATTSFGAYGNSLASYRMKFFVSPAGSTSSIVFDQLDFSSTTGNMLSFDYAKYHKNFINGDRLDIEASSDCGATWTTVWTKSGSAFKTGTSGQGSNYSATHGTYPAATDWVTDSIDLSAFDGQSAVAIRFVGTSGRGDNLWLDNINTFNNTVTSATALEGTVTNFTVFPNPAQNVLTVQTDLAEATDFQVSIVNALGQEVQTLGQVQMTEGVQQLEINTAELSNGLYFLNFTTDKGTMTERFQVLK